MINIWHDVDPDRIKPDDFLAVIEISKGSKNKYELDKETGLLILDRVLYTSTHYPANYGFIPLTYSEDLDPLDVLVLSSEVIRPLALCRCYPIGMITMIDEGYMDSKIIAIPFRDPSWNTYTDISEVYKNLEGKETAVVKQDDALVARQAIADAIAQYKIKFPKK